MDSFVGILYQACWWFPCKIRGRETKDYTMSWSSYWKKSIWGKCTMVNSNLRLLWSFTCKIFLVLPKSCIQLRGCWAIWSLLASLRRCRVWWSVRDDFIPRIMTLNWHIKQWRADPHHSKALAIVYSMALSDYI